MENDNAANNLILVFSKVLTESDIDSPLFFTTDEFLNHLKSLNNDVAINPKYLEINVIDDANEIWQLGSGWFGTSSSTVEAKRWSRFVYDKKLTVGDLVELYSYQVRRVGGGTETRFRIMTKKPITDTKLFGQTVGYYSPVQL
ncbi:hypothetical protein ACFE04_003723 [Oxalis oulophora]